ncbi:MAG: helicase HerA-like domain-containing protein [Hyphomicrobiaceae bacterium]|nr:helicase HerA-like domain-containing protein [Hyphomicrobiaceae bacterium]
MTSQTRKSADMQQRAHEAIAPDQLSDAFEHSITWEDDVWRADPVDVEEVHAKARRKFSEVLKAVTGTGTAQARILLFHGQSGAGKTHLVRALRTRAHREGAAYFGYAQMTPDVGSYADYFLRRLVHSLEKPYDPDTLGSSGLQRLTDGLVERCASMTEKEIEALREGELSDGALARMVLALADRVVADPVYAGEEPDVNIVRALLYLQRRDSRIDQRIRQYLYGRQLTPLAHEAVAALDTNEGEGRAFEIIAALGQLMWAVDKAALVFVIDQVEDLINFSDPEVRFQKAVGDLMQITNRVPSAISIISCLDDFYERVRSPLPQSFVDRIEKSGPVQLLESRTVEEARRIIGRRLEHFAELSGPGVSFPDASAFFGREFFEEFGGLSTRRILEHAQNRLRAQSAPAIEEEPDDGPMSFVASLAAALGFSVQTGPSEPARGPAASAGRIDYRGHWERFHNEFAAEMPSDDHELMTTLAGTLQLARDEWGGTITLRTERVEVSDEVPAIDLWLSQPNGLDTVTRVFLCNKPSQGGGLKRQIDKVLTAMPAGKTCIMLRASDFPPNKKNQTALAYKRYVETGGRQILIPVVDWERMLTVRQFYDHHRSDPGFTGWFADAKLLSNSVPAIAKLLRLELLARPAVRALPDIRPPAASVAVPAPQAEPDIAGLGDILSSAFSAEARGADAALSDASGARPEPSGTPATEDDVLPVSELLDVNGELSGSILAGREISAKPKPVTLNMSVMKRHSAVLGGSGSGKTTLALSLIEQLLQRGIPAILIDRKGDLCSYANPDVWRLQNDEASDRQSDREKLADAIDVAVYTPGRASGRPISITLLPNGMNELPDHEQQLLANLSAAAIGEMLHLKNSATHQKQSGVLSVALRILGANTAREVTLVDLIDKLEEEDPELTDRTQRMDPSGKIRRDLVAQLDSLRHRNAALFEGGGEPMSMESFLGLGRYARPGQTRLSIIYTGFLGDNENILFWVSQFLSEALRFCQRNPNDELQAVVMFDEADLYIPANAKPATAEPLQSLLKRARSAGLGLMLATQSPGDLDYKSRDQITSWFIGRVREDTALRKLKAAFQSESGLDAAAVLPGQTVGEFHLVQEGLVRPMKAQRSLIQAEQVPFDRIEQLARETKGMDERQLKLFDLR